MADFATDFFSHRWDFFKDPINRLLCSADDDDDDDSGGGASGGSGDDDNTGATFGGDARDTANYGDDDGQSAAEATREADRAAGLGGGGSSGISSGGTPSGGQFGGDARDTGGYGDDDGLSPAEATRESNRADALGRLAGPAGGEDGASIRDMLLSAFGGAFSSPAAAGELPTEGMPNPNFNQGYNVTGLPAGMKDQSRLSRQQLAADETPMDTLNQLLGPGEASDTFAVPTITPDQFGFNPFAPQTQVADANVPLPRADPRTQIGDATFDRSQFPFGPGGAPSTQQGRQVASLSDRFRDPQQPEPLRANDPLPEGGTVSNPITPRGSYGGLSDIATGGYAQNQGPFAPSILDQLAQQYGGYGGFDHQYTSARAQNDPPGPKDRS